MKTVAAIVLVLLALVMCVPDSPEEKDRKSCNDSTMAYIMTQGFVEKRLRAPSTAKFPSHYEIKTVLLGNCRHDVTAYVDAQNGFGAMIRTPYHAVIKYNGNDMWQIESLQMSE